MRITHFALLVICAVFSVASGQIQTYTYKTVDGLNLTLDINVPASTPYTKYPVFFGIHGGGYVEGAKTDGFSPLEQDELTSLGIVTVSIDYRLSPDALIQDIFQDVEDAYNWVLTELPSIISIDTSSIIIFGRSAGGGLAVMSGYMLTPRPKAVIAFYPYCTNFTDIYSYNPDTPVSLLLISEADLLRQPLAEYTPPKKGINLRSKLFKEALKNQKGGWLLATKKVDDPTTDVMTILEQYSAVDHVDQDYPPTYLIHGLNDTLVPHNQSIMMADVLNATNINYELTLVPDVNHGFDDFVTDNTSVLWQQYILPVFDFAQKILANDLELENEQISI